MPRSRFAAQTARSGSLCLAGTCSQGCSLLVVDSCKHERSSGFEACSAKQCASVDATLPTPSRSTFRATGCSTSRAKNGAASGTSNHSSRCPSIESTMVMLSAHEVICRLDRRRFVVLFDLPVCGLSFCCNLISLLDFCNVV